MRCERIAGAAGLIQHDLEAGMNHDLPVVAAIPAVAEGILRVWEAPACVLRSRTIIISSAQIAILPAPDHVRADRVVDDKVRFRFVLLSARRQVDRVSTSGSGTVLGRWRRRRCATAVDGTACGLRARRALGWQSTKTDWLHVEYVAPEQMGQPESS